MMERAQNPIVHDEVMEHENERYSGDGQTQIDSYSSEIVPGKGKSFTQDKTPGELADRYRFVRKIGSGSQGDVYLADRLSDHTQVAIKVLRIDSLQNWKAYDLFWREVNTLKSLDIDGIARFYEVIEKLDADQPCAYLVQQYIPGKSLAEMIKDGYRFDITVVFQIAMQLIDLLQQLHQHNPAIIHRDLKPSNIMVEKTDAGFKVYLMDFGAVANPLLQKGGSTVAGTYGYMPPEQLMGKPEPASDIYALGATLAGLLSGMEPSEMEIVGYRLAIEKPLENLPHAIVSCLRQMTQPKIEDRLCDYAAIRSRFELFTKGLFNASDLGLNHTQTGSEYVKKLKKVYALGLKDNYDLWNALPEETPRKLPRCYRWRSFVRRYRIPFTFFKFYNTMISNSYLIPLRFDPATTIRFPFYVLKNVLTFISLKIISLVVVGVFLYVLFAFFTGFFSGLSKVDIPFNAGSAALFALFGSIFVIVVYHYIRYRKACVLDKPKNKKTVYALLKYGRKTLAVIQSIQYHGVWEKCLNGYYLADSSLSRPDKAYYGTSAYYSLYSDVLPTICITYSFNPPDDSSLDDIVHSVFVPAISEKFLKEGDLLPILYEVNPFDNSIVNSMPFPLPMSYPMYIDDLVYVSEQNQVKSK